MLELITEEFGTGTFIFSNTLKGLFFFFFYLIGIKVKVGIKKTSLNHFIQ